MKNLSEGYEKKIVDERAKEEGIKKAESFNELIDFIDEINGLQGSSKFYQPIEILNIILRVRESKIDINYLTETGGLREKVVELLNIKKGREVQIKKGLANVKSFEDLYNFINLTGSIPSDGASDKEYSSKELKQYLDGVKFCKTEDCGDFRMIPSTGGLKEKVSELLDKEIKK
jgi:hypothetical protein